MLASRLKRLLLISPLIGKSTLVVVGESQWPTEDKQIAGKRLKIDLLSILLLFRLLLPLPLSMSLASSLLLLSMLLFMFAVGWSKKCLKRRVSDDCLMLRQMMDWWWQACLRCDCLNTASPKKVQLAKVSDGMVEMSLMQCYIGSVIVLAKWD